MTRAELKAARRRRQNRVAQQNRRAKQPKDDGQEPFDLPVYPLPVIVQQFATPAVTRQSEADAMADAPLSLPPTDPFMFDRAADKYRPAWVRAMDPNPAPIRLTADPRAAYHFGVQLVAAEAVEAAQEDAAKAAQEARARDRRAWTPGQTQEEL